MAVNLKLVAVGAIVLGGVVAGAYSVGMQAGAKTAVGAAPVASSTKPPAHPPLEQQANAAPPAEQREGKVQVDPSHAFTHFRVGNKNVKSIYADGKVMWVGTSGGVIRYDTATDDYKLYDARNGLLSNGVFYVGRLDGKVAIGTYGGGLSLLDEKTQKFETLTSRTDWAMPSCTTSSRRRTATSGSRPGPV
jgi:hypothetical protein